MCIRDRPTTPRTPPVTPSTTRDPPNFSASASAASKGAKATLVARPVAPPRTASTVSKLRFTRDRSARPLTTTSTLAQDPSFFASTLSSSRAFRVDEVHGEGLELGLLRQQPAERGVDAAALLEGQRPRVEERRVGEGAAEPGRPAQRRREVVREPTQTGMDADLQHEPEAVPAVCAPVLDGAADFAIGSRNTGDGGIGFEWSLLRRLISKGATLLAYPLTASTDPMSGFFCVRKQTLARGDPNPIGFKIALEIMVRCGCSSVVDVPITFRERTAGESKLSPKQNVEYLQQLAGLYWFARRYEVLALLFVLVVLVAYVASLVF